MIGLRSAFSLIYRPTKETKTCQFGTILDLFTRSTSRQCFSKFIFVADKLIFKISYSIYFDYFYTYLSISRPTMETKTCQFRNILDSARRSTSCQSFSEIRFCCRESPNPLVKVVIVLLLSDIRSPKSLNSMIFDFFDNFSKTKSFSTFEVHFDIYKPVGTY